VERAPAGADRSAPSLRPFLAGFWFGGFNGMTWMIGLGTPMVLLAERLGASTLQVGLASSFVFLLLPLQVLSTAALERLGYKRQMVMAWAARALFLFVPLGLTLAAPEHREPWMANLLVASIFGFCVFRAFGVAAHVPWMAAILPLEARGRFFATDQSITALVGVGTLLFCAALLRGEGTWEGFRGVYTVAILGSAAAVFCLTRLPGARPPRATPVARMPAEARRLCLTPGLFRLYLGLSLLGATVSSGMAPFTAYYLKVEAGLPASRILAYSAAHYAGAIVGAWAIRRLLDHLPVRRFFRISYAVQILVYGFWIALVLGDGTLAPWLPAAFAGFGIAIAIANSAHFTTLPFLSGEDERPLVVAVFTALFGFFAGLAPVLWGLLLKEAGPVPGMNVTAFAAYFATGIAVSLLVMLLLRHLPDMREQAPTVR